VQICKCYVRVRDGVKIRVMITVSDRVRTILVLGYRVLANTGRYWGGSGIGRYFFDCET